MKLLFCVILSLFVGNFNVGSAAVDVVKKLEKSDETKLTDLDEDCVFLIVKCLDADFAGLLNVARISDKFSTAAADSFRRKYPNHRIEIHHVFPLPENPNELLNVADIDIDIDTIQRLNEQLSHQFKNGPPIAIDRWSNQIYLNNGAEILDTFKHFGNVIKRIQFKIPSINETLHSEIVGKLISKYSSVSLENIELVDIENGAEKLLEHITNPLINVETAIFYKVLLSMNPKIIRPNELFPALRNLHLQPSTDDISYFNHHIPHLTHFTIARLNKEHNCSKFLDIFMKNPQFQSIHLYSVDGDFVQKLSNTFLPQLQELAIENLEVQNGRVVFENVTTFKIGYMGMPSNLHFPRLQMLHIHYNPEHFEAYRQFLNEHNHLIHLSMTSQNNLMDWNFEGLTADITDLVEFTLEELDCGSPPRLAYDPITVSADAILEFVSRQNKMKKLTVIGVKYGILYRLEEEIPWNQTIYRNRTVVFERE